jgi:hypothetical protein
MYALAQDLRFAFRQLRKAPGFSVTVVLTLALGIGATTAIFSLVEGILLRPLPFRDADRLVLLGDHLAGGRTRPAPFPLLAATTPRAMSFPVAQFPRKSMPHGSLLACSQHSALIRSWAGCLRSRKKMRISRSR